jgi:hypothetical protein
MCGGSGRSIESARRRRIFLVDVYVVTVGIEHASVGVYGTEPAAEAAARAWLGPERVRAVTRFALDDPNDRGTMVVILGCEEEDDEMG